jgi:hypothetical protein
MRTQRPEQILKCCHELRSALLVDPHFLRSRPRHPVWFAARWRRGVKQVVVVIATDRDGSVHPWIIFIVQARANPDNRCRMVQGNLGARTHKIVSFESKHGRPNVMPLLTDCKQIEKGSSRRRHCLLASH